MSRLILMSLPTLSGGVMIYNVSCLFLMSYVCVMLKYRPCQAGLWFQRREQPGRGGRGLPEDVDFENIDEGGGDDGGGGGDDDGDDDAIITIIKKKLFDFLA